jgi:hypothetical protein
VSERGREREKKKKKTVIERGTEREMGGADGGFSAVERRQSIDAHLRLLAPEKVSEDDKLVEYDAVLNDRFLDILQDLHGSELRELVHAFSCLSVYHASGSEFLRRFFFVIVTYQLQIQS